MHNKRSRSSRTARERSISDQYMDGESPWVAHCYVTDPAGARRIPVEIPSGENNVVGTLGDVYDTDSSHNMGNHLMATATNDLADTQGNSPPALHDVNNGLCDAGMHTGTACYVTNGPTSSGSSSVVSAELMGNRTLGSNHPRICTNGTPAKYSSYHSRSDVDMCTGSQPFRTTAEMDSRKLEIPLGHRSCYIQEWPGRQLHSQSGSAINCRQWSRVVLHNAIHSQSTGATNMQNQNGGYTHGRWIADGGP